MFDAISLGGVGLKWIIGEEVGGDDGGAMAVSHLTCVFLWRMDGGGDFALLGNFGEPVSCLSIGSVPLRKIRGDSDSGDGGPSPEPTFCRCCCPFPHLDDSLVLLLFRIAECLSCVGVSSTEINVLIASGARPGHPSNVFFCCCPLSRFLCFEPKNLFMSLSSRVHYLLSLILATELLFRFYYFYCHRLFIA